MTWILYYTYQDWKFHKEQSCYCHHGKDQQREQQVESTHQSHVLQLDQWKSHHNSILTSQLLTGEPCRQSWSCFSSYWSHQSTHTRLGQHCADPKTCISQEVLRWKSRTCWCVMKKKYECNIKRKKKCLNKIRDLYLFGETSCHPLITQVSQPIDHIPF